MNNNIIAKKIIAAVVLTLSTACLAQDQSQQTPSMFTDPAIVEASRVAAESGGTGSYKSYMQVEPTLPTHTVYRPNEMTEAGKLPIVVWGNGACVNYGNRFRYFLTEIASHGYLIAAIGPIGPSFLEGHAAQIPPDYKPPASQDKQEPMSRKPSSWSMQLTDAINWALAENSRKNSPYYKRLDIKNIAIMGQSCGGLQAIAASADPRVTTTVVWNSGTFPDDNGFPGAAAIKANLADLHAPVAFISGDASDIAFNNADADFDLINHIPVFRAYKKGVGHTGTYRTPNGGSFGEVAVKWLDWQLKGDNDAASWFQGNSCKLCVDPNWVARKKNIDK